GAGGDPLLDQVGQVAAYRLHGVRQIKGLDGVDDPPGPAERKQVVDERSQALTGQYQMVNVLLTLLAETVGVVQRQEIAERLEGAKRFLEVVRDDVGEVVQLAIDAAQLGVGSLQLLGLGPQRVGQAAALG